MENAPVVLITGASQGIGAAAARQLLAKGCRVATTARSGQRVEAALARAAPSGDALLVLEGDVALPADCRRWVAETIARFHRLDAWSTMRASSNLSPDWRTPIRKNGTTTSRSIC